MSPSDRRSQPDRRVVSDRRKAAAEPQGADARPAREQRRTKARRSGAERRSNETVEEHLRNALQLLGNIAETGSLDDEARRDLDAAMFRLRFAVERLRYGAS